MNANNVPALCGDVGRLATPRQFHKSFQRARPFFSGISLFHERSSLDQKSLKQQIKSVDVEPAEIPETRPKPLSGKDFAFHRPVGSTNPAHARSSTFL
jgi:hypothetical protein